MERSASLRNAKTQTDVPSESPSQAVLGASSDAPSSIAEADFTQTGYSYTLSLIQGKHKMVILYCLMEYEPVRFNEMRR